MSRKLSHLIATRKSKTIVVTVLLIYSLLTFHLSNKRLLSQFYPGKDDFKQTLLPTTSHSQDINLKKQITVNKKKINCIIYVINYRLRFHTTLRPPSRKGCGRPGKSAQMIRIFLFVQNLSKNMVWFVFTGLPIFSDFG